MAKNFNEKLIELLKNDSRFVDDEGELVKAAVIDRAWKIDRDLVKLLLGKSEIKEKFFDEIEGHWIFNINTFIEYVADKNFLANSYTRFRNKIGLNIDGKFLRERGEVSLVWPYKDCVLEGGQTKEEEKRKEIFFNEILAQDEIDRLFDSKVLTNWKRYTVAGEQKVTEIKRDENGTIRENLIIKGNNLLALHTLKKQFRGKVKLIYIDPPYNTNSGGFNYNDSFSHSAWMTFIKDRIKVAKEFLSKDGVIVINSDEIEHAYMKLICDEIFGRDNFQGDFIWRKRKGGGNDSHFLALDHDYLLVYTKNGSKSVHGKWRIPYDPKYLKRYSETDENGERYYWDTLSRDGLQHPIVVKLKMPDCSDLQINSQKSEKTINKELKSGHIRITKTNRGWSVQHRVYKPEGKVARSILDDLGTNKTANDELVGLFGSSFFKYPKPEKLISFLLNLFTQEGDLVFDYFVGSGTTAAVAHKMKRFYICIEQLDYIKPVPVDRLVKVVKGEQGGISKEFNWQGGGDFIYCELMKYNAAFMDKIQAAKTSEELVNLWKDIAENSFLNWYVNPEMPEKVVNDFIDIGKTENGLDKQKKLLAELLNKNQLYVNLSEIDDADFNVSDGDKKLNQSFYGENA